MDRNENRRDKDIVPVDQLAEIAAVVIGVGAIGSQAAKQLAHLGVGQLVLIDPDTVSEENLATQGFWQGDLGTNKVQAIGYVCSEINPHIDITQHVAKFDEDHLPMGRCAVFMCVDDMDARIDISKACAEEPFFIDGRMSAEVTRILTAVDKETHGYYRTTLFSADEAYQESCTAKGTIYCACIAAGLMVSQFTKWLRGFPVKPDVELNMLSMELCDEAVEEPAAV